MLLGKARGVGSLPLHLTSKSAQLRHMNKGPKYVLPSGIPYQILANY